MGPLELVILLVALAVISLVVLVVRRLVTHPCPSCGNRVRSGRTACAACGSDASARTA